MPSYIAFLRAINIGKRQVKMADLRTWLAEDGFDDVETYIQTGNVRVGADLRSPGAVERRIEEILRRRCGFEVPAIILTPAELSQAYADALAIAPPPYAGDAEERRYVVFFKDAPTAEQVAACTAYQAELERAWVIGRVAHIWTAARMQDAKIFGALQKVFEPGTNRSLTVVAKLAERWGG